MSFGWFFCLFVIFAAIRVCAGEPLTVPVTLPGTNLAGNVRAECGVKSVAPVPVLAVAFSPDGRFLAAGGYHEVLLWDLEKAALAKRFGALAERVRSVTWAADGKVLFVADGNAGIVGILHAIDIASGKLTVISNEAKDELLSTAVSADGKLVVVSGIDGTIRVFSVPDYKLVTKLKEHSDRVTAVTFSSDGDYMLGAGVDRLAVVWEVNGWKPAVRLTQPDPISGAAFSPEADLIAFATANPSDPAVRLVRFNPEVATNATATAKGRKRQNNQPNARSIDCGTTQPQCVVWTTNSGSMTPRRGAQNAKPSLRLLAACESVAKEFSVNGDAGPVLSGHGDWIYAASLDPTQMRLATASGDGTVKLWNLSTDRLLATLVNPRQPDGWALITARGFFSASSPELLDWHIAKPNQPIETLRRRLERPERVAAIISGDPQRQAKEAQEPIE